MSRVFFTSDPHFGHANVIKYCSRPFTDVQHMNEMMVVRWNEIVRPEDTVYVLGDFSLGKNWVREITPRLMGTKHLIAGNHDWCHPVHAKKPEKIEKFTKLYLESGFASVKLEDIIEVEGRRIRLHHMPYQGDHTPDERYHEWRPKDDGLWLFHGHVHDLWRFKGRQINVGVDQWDFRPVGLETLMEAVRG
jgi:calcineurin-like phosphoesterase family protein